MEKIIFQQDPSLSGETMTLHESRLVISTHAMGLNQVEEFKLKDLSSTYEETRKRFWHLCITPLMFSVAMPLLAWWLIRQNSEFAIVAIIAAILSFWHTFDGLQPIETTVFRSRDGEKVAEIYRPRKATLAKRAKAKNIYQSSAAPIDYHEFVAALRDRIKISTSSSHPEVNH